MIRFSDILGQEPATRVLRDAVLSGTLHHALLFVGADGVGKFTTAKALAAFLLCPSRGEQACGSEDCSVCRHVEAGSHPDLHIVGALEGKRDVSIEQVRELQAALGQTALAGGKKVAIVDDAHCLSEPAQNAFLKTLEAPPGDTVVILISRSASAMLPTIRSRCQRVVFRPLPTAVVQTIVEKHKGLPPAEARLLAEYSLGSPGTALAVGEASRVREARDGVRALLEQVRHGRYRDVVAAQQQTVPRKQAAKDAEARARRRDVERDQAPEAIALLVELLRGDLRATAGVEASPELTARGKTESLSEALRRVEAAYRALVDLGRNAHAALAIERLWLRLGRDRA